MINELAFYFYSIALLFIPISLYGTLNLSKKNRPKQYFFPIAAVLYCIIYIIFIEKLQGIIIDLTAQFSYLYSLIGTLPFININFSIPTSAMKIMHYMVNLVMLYGFLAFKMILSIVARLVVRDKGWGYRNIAGVFYEKVNKHSTLKDNWILARKFINFLYIVINASVIFILLNYVIFADTQTFPYFFYIAFVIIVLGEILDFLNGYNKFSYKKAIGDLGDEDKHIDFSKMVDVYKKVFGDRIAYSNTFINRNTANSFSTAVLDKLEKSNDKDDNILGCILEKHFEAGYSIDNNLVLAAKKLLKGKSILFTNPFYRDIAPYIFLPINQCLLGTGNVLIILGRDETKKEFIAFFTEWLNYIMGVPNYWRIGELSNNNDVVDAGIITASNLYDLKTYDHNIDFLENVGFVLMLEPSRMLSTDQIALSLYIDSCNKYNNAVYASVDRNMDGLLDSVSHVTRTSIEEVGALNNVDNESSIVAFDADGGYIHHRLFNDVSRYLGIGIELALVAAKNQVRKVTWYSIEKFPVKDMAWIASQYYDVLCKYISKEKSQSVLEETIKYSTDLWGLDTIDNDFVVVEDEYNNLFEMYKYANSRVFGQCFVNIISGNYMLKEYMNECSHIFLNDTKAIPSIAADYVRSHRNLIVLLILLMSETSISESFIMQKMSLHNIITDDIGEMLERMINQYILGCEKKDVLSVEFREDFSEKVFGETEAYYSIAGNDLLDNNINMLTKAYYILEDEEEKSHLLGYELMGHVYQKHLPTQYMVYDGKYYEVTAVSETKGVLVKRASDHIDGRWYYNQAREYTFGEMIENITSISIDGISISKGVCNIDVSTFGYYKMMEKGDINTAKFIGVDNIPERHLICKEVIVIDFGDVNEETIKTMTIALNELFYTVFPNDYHYICAVCIADSAIDGYGFRSNISDNTIMIVEDSQMDLGLLHAFERNFSRFMEIITDYFVWNVKCFSNKESDDDDSTGRVVRNYFKFGYDTAPDFIDITGCIELLKSHNFHNSYISQARYKSEWDRSSIGDYQPNLPNTKYCDFCAEIITGVSYTELDDGRMRCDTCSETIMDNLEEFEELISQVKENMEKFFRIEINEQVDIRIENAKVIARKLGSRFKPTDGFDARAIGFARKRRNEYSIYVENGSPKVRTMSTLVHEFTHIWQFSKGKKWRNFNRYNIKKKNNEMYEGMAMWAEIQYLIYYGEVDFAKRLEINTLARDDAYGNGLRIFMDKYPFSYKKSYNQKNPFDEIID